MFQSPGSTSTGGWPIANVYFLGFGQGGSMALEIAINCMRNGRPLGLGGVISLSGFLASFEKSGETNQTSADVLITYGSEESVPEALLERHRNFFSDRLELYKVTGKGQEMPKSPTEMRKMMEFFGARLALRNLAMEARADVIELTNE